MILQKLSILWLGPYAVYVLPCYFLFLVILCWHFLWARKTHVDTINKIQLLLRQESEHD